MKISVGLAGTISSSCKVMDLMDICAAAGVNDTQIEQAAISNKWPEN